MQEKLLADMLFDCGAVEIGTNRKLTSQPSAAAPSPLYFNLRQPSHPTNPGPLTPDMTRMIGEFLYQNLRSFGIRFGEHYDYVFGVPHSGVPLADAFSSSPWKSSFPLIPRIAITEHIAKDHRAYHMLFSPDGTQIMSDCPVLVVDNALASGTSSLRFIDILSQASLQVRDVLVVIDRQGGGSERLIRKGYRVYSLFREYSLMTYYYRTGRITLDQYRLCAQSLQFSA